GGMWWEMCASRHAGISRPIAVLLDGSAREPSTCTAFLSVWRPLLRFGRWRFRRDTASFTLSPAHRHTAYTPPRSAYLAEGFRGCSDNQSGPVPPQIGDQRRPRWHRLRLPCVRGAYAMAPRSTPL